MAGSPGRRPAQLWHGQRRTRRTLRTKQRKPALHELVKPYLDGLILIRDVEAGGSNPLTPTKNSYFGGGMCR